MKHYGLIVADNGSDWFFTGTADSGWDTGPYPQMISDLKQVRPGSSKPSTVVPHAGPQLGVPCCGERSPGPVTTPSPGTRPPGRHRRPTASPPRAGRQAHRPAGIRVPRSRGRTRPVEFKGPFRAGRWLVVTSARTCSKWWGLITPSRVRSLLPPTIHLVIVSSERRWRSHRGPHARLAPTVNSAVWKRTVGSNGHRESASPCQPGLANTGVAKCVLSNAG